MAGFSRRWMLDVFHVLLFFFPPRSGRCYWLGALEFSLGVWALIWDIALGDGVRLSDCSFSPAWARSIVELSIIHEDMMNESDETSSKGQRAVTSSTVAQG